MGVERSVSSCARVIEPANRSIAERQRVGATERAHARATGLRVLDLSGWASHDAREAHARNVPKGYEHILDDEPDYGGFLRGRVVTSRGRQLIVVYCRPEALATPGAKLRQFLRGIRDIPVPLSDDAVVISDNADLYGTLADLEDRERQAG